MPDDALLTSAAQGDLSSPTGLVEQTKRLLDDPKAAAGMTDFFSQLLDLKAVLYTQKEASRHPDFTQARKDAAYAASMQFITHVVLENKDDKNSLATLFTAPYAFVNQAMAPLYGLTDVRGGQLRKVDLPADQRAGLLTQPAFLAGHAGPADGASATPIKRGREIRSAVLCQAIPPPKENIVPKPSSGATTRQRLSEHASDPGCRSCHALMDPLGFAFESYDVTGAFRTKEGTVTIDTSGTLGGLEDGEKNFAGAVDLMKSVAASPEALDCAAQSLIRFATSREESDNESSAIVSALPEGNRSVRELVLAIVTSRGFTHRSPNAQEKQ